MRIRAYLAVSALLIATAGAAWGQNMLPNGGFEASPNGTQVTGQDYIDTTTFPGWRVFAVGGFGSTYTVTGAAARSGAVGMEMAYDIAGADSALDMDDPSLRLNIPTEQRIYKQLVDVRDGGVYGGSPSFVAGFQFPTIGYSHGIDPQANWETMGLTGRSDGQGTLSVRYDMNPGGGVNKSVYIDNARVVDVTHADRMVNGGFENSDTRPINWRFFAVAGATGSATITNDAASGSNAVVLERTAAAGDSGLDLWDDRVATLGGETLHITFKAKKEWGDNAMLRLTLAAWDDLGNFQGDLVNYLAAGGDGAFDTYSLDVPLYGNTASVSLAFRVMDANHAPTVGAFTIDDVVLMPEPASLMLLGLGLLAAFRRR